MSIYPDYDNNINVCVTILGIMKFRKRKLIDKNVLKIIIKMVRYCHKKLCCIYNGYWINFVENRRDTPNRVYVKIEDIESRVMEYEGDGLLHRKVIEIFNVHEMREWNIERINRAKISNYWSWLSGKAKSTLQNMGYKQGRLRFVAYADERYRASIVMVMSSNKHPTDEASLYQ